MADAEHSLYADPNNSSSMKEVLPNGTPAQFLSDAHVLRHEELLDYDIHIEDKEKAALLKHIKLDIDNWKQLQAEQTPPTPIPQGAVSQVGGLPSPITATVAQPRSPTL